MKTATMTEMKQHPDRIMKIARKEAVTITERGKPLLIIRKARAEASLESLKGVITHSDDDLNDFGVFDWQ